MADLQQYAGDGGPPWSVARYAVAGALGERALESSGEPSHWTARELDALAALAPRCEFDGKKLARMFNVSQRHLQRVFLARFACSPQAWLNERRLHLAWHMLQSADSVKEVAHSLGFRRASQFSRDFRRLFGLTPSEVSSRARPSILTIRARTWQGRCVRSDSSDTGSAQ